MLEKEPDYVNTTFFKGRPLRFSLFACGYLFDVMSDIEPHES